MKGKTRKNRSAFTLVELLIVVSLVGVLVSIAVPAFRSHRTQSLESVARILAADLRLARSQAIQFNTEYTVRFDVANNAYELVHTGTGNPPPLRNPLAPVGEEDGPYRVEVGRLGTPTTGNNGIRLVGAVLEASRQTVDEVTLGPLGGTGPTRTEDTLIGLATKPDEGTRFVLLTVSWINGQVWIDPPRVLSP